jgi:uncharacterized membrane protein YgaE (UPF0421/DUF939 family)
MKKLIPLLQRTYIRFALWSALAATFAYLVAYATPWISAPVAGLTALISVRPTFHDTAEESWRQVLGTILAVLFALGLSAILSDSPLMVFLLVIFSFALAHILKLGESGAATMGVTAILVIGHAVTTSTALERVLGVALGAIVAVLASVWVRPGKPHHRALKEAVALSEGSAGLLSEIADHLAHTHGRVDLDTSIEWMERAEKGMTQLAAVRAEAEAALTSARWSPLVNQQEAAAVLDQVKMAQETARTVYTMSHDLKMAAETERALPRNVATQIAGVLSATAAAVQGQAEVALENPAESLDHSDSPVTAIYDQRDEAVTAIRDMDHTQSILLAGSLLRDSQKITGAITDGPEPLPERDNREN